MINRPPPQPLARLRARAAPHLAGPYPTLPRPLDTLSEHWSRLRPRARMLVAAAAVVAVALAVAGRIHRAEQRWGGTSVDVLVAVEDLPVGTRDPAVRAVAMPPAAVPPAAVTEVPPEAALAFAVPQGAVLTAAHLDPRGPAVGLADGFRAVPVPVDDGWGVAAGGWVDVWVLGVGDQPARQVARSRAVLEITDDDMTRTALVGLAKEEVGPTTEGLALGQVLLTHAPVP